MEFEIINVRVPVNTCIDIQNFTPEENCIMLKTGREYVIHKKTDNEESIRELVEKIKKMETQIAKLKNDLQTYGVVYMDK